MTHLRFLTINFLFSVLLFEANAQEPVFFDVSKEATLPSNEIYSIVQDNNGFIWIGSDAGLYKYNGVAFDKYESNSQKSLSITGLTISSNNHLYCYNFSDQLFCLKNNELNEIKGTPSGISSLMNDNQGNIIVSAHKGIYV